jgi:CRISPR-associated protein Cas2
MLIAVAYDVRDDKRRTKLSDALQNYGKRVQLSVFECLLDEAQVERLREMVGRIIAAEEDTVRIYRLCGVCEPKVEVVGVGVRTEDPDVYIV